MPTSSLGDISDGSNVFIDANIFVYGLSGTSVECLHLLERCSKEEVTGVTLFEIVNEATHRFMLAEAVSKGHIASENARALRSNFNVIKTLTAYWQDTKRILLLNLLFLSTEESIVNEAQTERSRACLLTNDSMIVACMRQYGLSSLASADGDFGRANGIILFRPGDLP